VFQTLVVSQPEIRVDRRAGLTAFFLHVILISLVAQLRPRSSAPVSGLPEPIRFVVTARPRLIASAALPASRELSPAPRHFAGELLRLPSIPSMPVSAASPPLDLARIAGSGQATPLTFLEWTKGDGEVPGMEEVDQAPKPDVPLLPSYPAVLRAAGVTGEVVIEYVVDQAGRVDTSAVRAVAFTHPDFVPPIREALAGVRFTAALRAGAPVAVRVRQRIVFEIR
jgi:TonB family protein